MNIGEVVVMTMATGDCVVGVLSKKPDVTVTLHNPLKYEISNGFSMFSRYNIFTSDEFIEFNRDSVIAIMSVTANREEYYHLMVKYVSKFVDDSFDRIVLEGIGKLKEFMDKPEDEQPIIDDRNLNMSTGDTSVEEFFKMNKPKDQKPN